MLNYANKRGIEMINFNKENSESSKKFSLFADVNTGNVPLTARVFTILLDPELIPFWNAIGIYDILYQPIKGIEIGVYLPIFNMSLTHLCAHPEIHIGNIVVPEDLEYKSKVYLDAIYVLARITTAAERYPAASIILE